MKVLCEIPDDAVELWRENPQIGRMAIQENLGCGEKAARFYARALKNGKVVHTDDAKNLPESSEDWNT